MKSAVEAKQALPKNATPSKLSKETAKELDAVASPGRVVEAKTDGSQSGPMNSTGSLPMCKSVLSQNLREKRDSKKADGCNRYYRNGSAKDRLGFENSGSGSISPLRRTPTSDRDPGDGTVYRNNGTREKLDSKLLSLNNNCF